MISVAEARAAIRESLGDFGIEAVALAASRGRVLRQAVVAERDQPPYDRVTMDGVALRHAALGAGRRSYRIAGTQQAGDPPLALAADDQCIEVMTGAVLPAASDCVVPVERLQKAAGSVTVEAGYEAAARQFVHDRGSDHVAGATLLDAGRRITPIDIALLASAGLATVDVARLPAVCVISTGNELVPPGRPIAAHQVRLSNAPALVAMLEARGFTDSSERHLPDDPDTLRREIGAALAGSDVLVLSGGVSMGQADFVPRILDELGVGKVFHRISQRPGKPMWFGLGPGGEAVFALPGNPVSALTCCRHYVLPALDEASGAPAERTVPAELAEDYRFAPPLTCFLPVRAAVDETGRLRATPVPTNTSGDFTSLAATDGYLVLERDCEHFAAGSVQPLCYW